MLNTAADWEKRYREVLVDIGKYPGMPKPFCSTEKITIYESRVDHGILTSLSVFSSTGCNEDAIKFSVAAHKDTYMKNLLDGTMSPIESGETEATLDLGRMGTVKIEVYKPSTEKTDDYRWLDFFLTKDDWVRGKPKALLDFVIGFWLSVPTDPPGA